MAIPTTQHVWTYDDYMQMEDDGKRYEILDGELIELASPNLRHQQILGRLFRSLSSYAEAQDLGQVILAPFDVKLSPIDVVQPGVVFIATNHLDILDNSLNAQGAPDLCVEILSPGTRARDLRQKRDRYARFGVREYWIIDPDAETISVLALRDGAYVTIGEATGNAPLHSAVLPGFAATAAALFPQA